ncbi:MAG: class I SAM-dependent methyltransferase [Gammaproteobacteria bacterium]|nr:class I SAM-dependent methyltransferase [Gammaproteobacteria bacterium]
MREETRNRKRMYDEHTGSSYEADRYGDPYKEQYRQIRNEALVDLIGDNFGRSKPLRVLEIGCGTGMTLGYLASLPARHELHGMDFSQTMLSQARQKLNGLENPFRLAQGDSFELPFRENVFDVVYSTRFIHQFSHDDKKSIYREMLRVLKPGGLVINEFYSRHSKWSLYLRGLREYPTENQCPSKSEVDDIVGGPCARRPVRVVGLRAINNLFGEQALRHVISLASRPVLNILLEEYFVASRK